MSLFKNVKHVLLLKKLSSIEAKRKSIQDQRSRLKWQAQCVKTEFEACLLEIQVFNQDNPNAVMKTNISPKGIKPEETFGKLGS